MCHHIVDLYLHCSHVTIQTSYCASNPQLAVALINTGAGNRTTVHPRYRTSSYVSVSLAERCPKQARPETHSYLLCCPSCRGRLEHPKYEVTHGHHREWAHDTKRFCARSDNKTSTLPTCARLKMQLQSHTQTQTTSTWQQQTPSIFTYGLGFNINVWNSLHDQGHVNVISDSSAHLTRLALKFDVVETYLRFPLTKCHHLILFNMPETFLDESSDSILPCGCWTGKAPDAQIQEATLFVDYIGAESNFKSVWDVTGLGAGGCWECGALEFEVGDGYGAEGCAVENSQSQGHAGQGYNMDGLIQTSKQQTDEGTRIEGAFMMDCEQWRKMEDWKNKWWNGDMTERGAKIMAESRWLNNEN